MNGPGWLGEQTEDERRSCRTEAGETRGIVVRDYVDGYQAGFRDGPYDPDRFGQTTYRRGMQEGRTHRIDDELTADTYGDRPHDHQAWTGWLGR